MAEKNFEEKAAELREARDIYMEREVEGGTEGIGIVPGATGVRSGRGRRIDDEVKEHSNVLKGIREEVQELKRVISELRGGLVETSEAFKEFHKGFSHVGKEFQEFGKGFSQVVKEFRELSQGFSQVGRGFQEFSKGFSQFVKEFKEFQQEFSYVSKGLREEFSKLSEWLGDLSKQLMKGYSSSIEKLSEWSGKLSERFSREYRSGVRKLSRIGFELDKKYEEIKWYETDVDRIITQARRRRREAREQESRQGERYVYSGLGRRRGSLGGGIFKFPESIMIQERRHVGGSFRRYNDYLRYGRKYEEKEFQFGVMEWAKSLPVELLFGASGGGSYGRGRWRGSSSNEILGEVRNIMYAALGPIGMHIQEWMEGMYEKWAEWKEYKKGQEEERRAELASRGIYKVRQIERGERDRFSEIWDFTKELLGFRGIGRGGVVLSAVGSQGRVSEFRTGGQGRVSRFERKWMGLEKVVDLLESKGKERMFDKVSLSNEVELVQEIGEKIYTDKLHIEAKQVSGAGGGGGILDMLSGGKLLGKVGRLSKWAGRLGLGVGAGLAFLSGLREEGLGRGIFRGLGALGGGLGGMKLGALIGTAIAPGIGTAVGSVLGGVLGMFGGEKIADAVYSGMKKLLKDKDWIESLGKGFSSVVGRIGNFLKGIVEGVKSGISAVSGAVSGVAGDVMSWLKEKVGEIDLGIVSRIFEVGEARAAELSKAAGVVGYTKGDIGGMSAGMYQFTKDAQLKFLREYGFMKEFEGVEFGTQEWRKRWEEVAKKHGERFAKAQQEFAMKEYFAPGASVAEKFGINVMGSRALQEMVFARTIQHGKRGFERVLANAFKGMTYEQVKAMSPQEIIMRVYDHLIANVDKYWARSSSKVREGVRKRLLKEKELLLAIERKGVEGLAKKEVGKGVKMGTVEELKDMQEFSQKEGSKGVKMTTVDGLKGDMQGVTIREVGRGMKIETVEELKDVQGFTKREGSKGVKMTTVDDLKGDMQGVIVDSRWSPYLVGEYDSDRVGQVGLIQERGRGVVNVGVDQAQLIDSALLTDQQEVARRVIEEGVKREVEWLGSVVNLIEGLKGRVEEAGSGRKIIMSGGDAFSKVQLFPEDMGLVMMMLGLV